MTARGMERWIIEGASAEASVAAALLVSSRRDAPMAARSARSVHCCAKKGDALVLLYVGPEPALHRHAAGQGSAYCAAQTSADYTQFGDLLIVQTLMASSCR